MKKLMAAAIFAASTQSAVAGFEAEIPSSYVYEPTFFLGLTWSLGGGNISSALPGSSNVGVTLKYLSTNEPDTLAAAIGLTYFLDGSIGCDAGVGLNHNSASLGVSYDFCRQLPQISLGGIKKPEMQAYIRSVAD